MDVGEIVENRGNLQMETSDTISLVFVRHGRSVAQGEKGSRRMRAELRDASLAADGRKQAEALAKSLTPPESGGVRIVASPLRRALQTAAILRKGALASLLQPEDKIVAHPGLAEHGDLPENHGSSASELREDPMLQYAVDFGLAGDSDWPRHGGVAINFNALATWLHEQRVGNIVIVGHKVTLTTLIRDLGIDAGYLRMENCVPVRAVVSRSKLRELAARHAGGQGAAATGSITRTGSATGSADHDALRLIVLSGLPGSGKSTFARALASCGGAQGGKAPGPWRVVSSDDDGKDWAAKMGRELRAGHRVIVDRVNPTHAARREVLEIASRSLADVKGSSCSKSKHSRKGAAVKASTAALVYFDVDEDECARRAVYRTMTGGHPTVKAGKESKAVSGAAGVLEPPRVSGEDDGFCSVHICRTGRDSFQAFQTLSAPGLLRGLSSEIQRHWLGQLVLERALVYYPPLDSAVIRSVRDLQIEISRHKTLNGESEEIASLPSALTRIVTGAIPLNDIHITLLSAQEMRACGASDGIRLPSIQSAADCEFLAKNIRSDGIPRLGRSGSKKTAFLALQDQTDWRQFCQHLLSEACASERAAQLKCRCDVQVVGLERDFHVSFWNETGAVYDSIGALSRAMDKKGENFRKMFPIAVDCLTTSGPVGLSSERLSASQEPEQATYAVQDMVLTQEEFRRGSTCRRPQAQVECRFKFPRSFHIRDTGNMEDDDLLVPEEDVSLFLGHPVTLEEKIDGANVGISLDLDNCFDDGSPAFRFQKRSHYVSAASESQFRGLDTWAEENAVALRRLLTIPFGRDRKPAKAGQRIVFGEWLQATHSKAYDKLPARFIVFDIFDAELRGGRGGFLSVKCRNRLLDHVNSRNSTSEPGNKVWRIRSVGAARAFKSVDEIVEVLNSEAGQSAYIRSREEGGHAHSHSRMEGLYLRVDDESTGLLIARAKLVHPDFHRMLAQGRWEGGARNAVRPDLWWGCDNDGNVEMDVTAED